jgi:hypothetical protein
MLAVRTSVEGITIGEIGHREREQTRSYLLCKLFQGHLAHGFPSIEIAQLLCANYKEPDEQETSDQRFHWTLRDSGAYPTGYFNVRFSRT